MAEQKTEVKTYRVDYVCDACGEGRMKPTGTVLTSNPEQYPHSCDKCATRQTFGVTYPRTEYEPAGTFSAFRGFAGF